MEVEEGDGVVPGLLVAAGDQEHSMDAASAENLDMRALPGRISKLSQGRYRVRNR